MSNNMYDNITGRSPIATDDLGYIGTGQKASQILSGGTTDYEDLTNKPSINSVKLSGNLTSSDLGLQPALTETQTAAVNSGIDSDKVAQIETNKNNILSIQQKTVTHNIITVGVGKQFQSVVLAVQSITDSSANNVYDIIIDAGTYDMFYDFDIATQTSDFVGLVLPDYVNLYGSGKENTILTGTLSGSETYAFSIDQVSPLNVFKHNIIKNLTVYGQNTRYAVHSDDRYKGETYGLTQSSDCYFENCKFQTPVRSGTSVAVPQAAYGYGISSGGKYAFKNCDFITTMLNLYVCNGHNNTNASEPTQELILDEKVRWRVQQKREGEGAQGWKDRQNHPQKDKLLF